MLLPYLDQAEILFDGLDAGSGEPDGRGGYSGSFFFPMVPGPQRLIARGRTGEQLLELTLELKPLAHLHLAP